MASKIFVNLPVKDLDRSKAFFAKLGYSFNPKFTDATAACMVISDDIYVMLLTEAKFKEFTTKPIANAKEATEVLVCLALESKAKVNERRHRLTHPIIRAGLSWLLGWHYDGSEQARRRAAAQVPYIAFRPTL